MGIVAAQCRVFIAQNDICAPRPLYYHLFPSIIAASQPAPLHAGSSIPSRLTRFRSRFASCLAPSRPSVRSPSRRAGRPATVFAIRGRSVAAFRVSSVPFPQRPLSFSRPFFVSSWRPRSWNRIVRGVPYRPMPYAPCRRFVPRPVFLRAWRSVSSVVSQGGEDGGEFYGMFHVKRGTSPCVFRCLPTPSASPVGRVGRSRPMPVCGSVSSSCLAVCIRMRGGEAFSVSYRLA